MKKITAKERHWYKLQCTNRPVSSAHISYIQCNLLSTALGFSHHSCVMSYFYVTIPFSLLLSAEREMTTGLPVRGTVAVFCGREGNRRSGDATAPWPVLTTCSAEDRRLSWPENNQMLAVTRSVPTTRGTYAGASLSCCCRGVTNLCIDLSAAIGVQSIGNY